MKANTETTNRSKIIHAKLDSSNRLLYVQRCAFPAPGMQETQQCTHLSDRHRAENVEEDEGAVSIILTQKVAVGETLDVREGDKWKLCDHSAIKSGKESTGSQLGAVQESLTAERTSEHPQQATRADKTMWKARKPSCVLQPTSTYTTPRRLNTPLSQSPPHSIIYSVSRLPSVTILPQSVS